MPSPFANTKPWQDRVLALAMKWATSGAPTKAEWDEWTALTYEASEDRRRSGWRGIDRIEDDAFSAGQESRQEEIEDWQGRAFDGP